MMIRCLLVLHASGQRAQRWIGCASSLILSEQMAFLADSFTVKASGSNWTKLVGGLEEQREKNVSMNAALFFAK